MKQYITEAKEMDMKKYAKGKTLLFVYGSMKRGFRNNIRLDKEVYFGDAITKEKYCMFPSVNFTYPYALKEDKRWQLKGELYDITNIDISVIDDFEGVPKFYYRESIEIIWRDQVTKAFIYFRSNENPNSYEKELALDEWTQEYEKVGYKYSDFLYSLKKAMDKYKKSHYASK